MNIVVQREDAVTNVFVRTDSSALVVNTQTGIKADQANIVHCSRLLVGTGKSLALLLTSPTVLFNSTLNKTSGTCCGDHIN